MRRVRNLAGALAGLVLFWLLLNQSLSLGQLLLACAVSAIGLFAFSALQLPGLRLRAPTAMLRLFGVVVTDILRSNLAVGRIVLGLTDRTPTAGFVTIPLDLRDPYGLAALACIITATPGTLWVNFDAAARELTIHVLDLPMSTVVLAWAIDLAQILLGIAAGCATFRMVRGPRAQDRVVGFDALYVNGMLLLLTFGIESGADIYFEAALIIALLGFVGTTAMAKFLLRGEAIE